MIYLDIGANGPGFVQDDAACVPVGDRSFLYGDGLFETVLVRQGSMPLLPLHLKRLCGSAQALGIACDLARIESAARQLGESAGGEDHALRITLSRGSQGIRGYAPPVDAAPTLLITIAPYHRPTGPLRAVSPSVRVWSQSFLNRHKSTSALEKVIARSEAARAMADEAVLLNEQGRIVEGTSANLFICRDRRWSTPPLSEGCLPGVMRSRVIAVTGATEQPLTVLDLLAADGVFLTNALMGCIPLAALDDQPLSVGPAAPGLEELMSNP